MDIYSMIELDISPVLDAENAALHHALYHLLYA